jgi:hypothetical protein
VTLPKTGLVTLGTFGLLGVNVLNLFKYRNRYIYLNGGKSIMGKCSLSAPTTGYNPISSKITSTPMAI